MVTKEVAESVGGLKKLVPTGTCVLIEGTLAQTPEGTKQVGRVCAKAAVSSWSSQWEASRKSKQQDTSGSSRVLTQRYMSVDAFTVASWVVS